MSVCAMLWAEPGKAKTRTNTYCFIGEILLTMKSGRLRKRGVGTAMGNKNVCPNPNQPTNKRNHTALTAGGTARILKQAGAKKPDSPSSVYVTRAPSLNTLGFLLHHCAPANWRTGQVPADQFTISQEQGSQGFFDKLGGRGDPMPQTLVEVPKIEAQPWSFLSCSAPTADQYDANNILLAHNHFAASQETHDKRPPNTS
eukprot:gene16783-23059_t